jgi:hypothetical protein
MTEWRFAKVCETARSFAGALRRFAGALRGGLRTLCAWFAGTLREPGEGLPAKFASVGKVCAALCGKIVGGHRNKGFVFFGFRKFDKVLESLMLRGEGFVRVARMKFDLLDAESLLLLV